MTENLYPSTAEMTSDKSEAGIARWIAYSTATLISEIVRFGMDMSAPEIQKALGVTGFDEDLIRETLLMLDLFGVDTPTFNALFQRVPLSAVCSIGLPMSSVARTNSIESNSQQYPYFWAFEPAGAEDSTIGSVTIFKPNDLAVDITMGGSEDGTVLPYSIAKIARIGNAPYVDKRIISELGQIYFFNQFGEDPEDRTFQVHGQTTITLVNH